LCAFADETTPASSGGIGVWGNPAGCGKDIFPLCLRVQAPGRQIKMYIFAMPAESVGHDKRKQAFETPIRRFMFLIGHIFEESHKSRHKQCWFGENRVF